MQGQQQQQQQQQKQQQQEEQQEQQEQHEQEEEEETTTTTRTKMRQKDVWQDGYKLRYEKNITLSSAPTRMRRAHEQHQCSHYFS